VCVAHGALTRNVENGRCSRRSVPERKSYRENPGDPIGQWQRVGPSPMKEASPENGTSGNPIHERRPVSGTSRERLARRPTG
jgi:hypothetical protein